VKLRIAEPCTEDWRSMSGDERSRWCARCELSVTNLTELRQPEAEALVARRDGRLCLRAVCDATGEIVTRTTHESRFLQALHTLAAHRAVERTP
jgi:hypothetical protein